MIEVATSNEHAEFCERVKARRIELGLTQADVAESLGITSGAYADFERGRKEPGLMRIYRVAHVLEVSVHELLPEAAVSRR